MVNLYKKDKNNKDLLIDGNPFMEPSLLCISSTKDKQNMFGTLNRALVLARVENKHDKYVYNLEDTNINFLVLEANSKDDLKDFTYKYFSKLLLDNNKDIIDIETIKKRFRNINIFSYCGGLDTYIKLEKGLKKMLLNKAFHKEDIQDILSNISLIALNTETNLDNINATTIQYQDVCDDVDIYSINYFEYIIDYLRSNNLSYVVSKKDNRYIFYYLGDGMHILKNTISNANICKPLMSANLIYNLNNSIINNDTNNYIKLDSKQIIDIITNGIPNNYSKSIEEYMEDIDNNIDYYNRIKRSYIKK